LYRQINVTMKKLLFTSILGVCLGYPFWVKAQVTPFLAGRFQFTLDSVCAKYKIKGASAAVLIPNVGIWKGVSGESEAGTPLTTEMYFGMGSNTKTHIAATLLKMQEQQLVSLDDTIGKWIQGYPNINGQITIRQCLNHTSGLFDYMQNDKVNDSIFGKPEKIWMREEILELAETPNFAAGTSWEYSNTNYIIAGIIIEKVLNKSPFTAIHELILTPNQLTHTFNFGEAEASNIAHPWSMSLDENSLTDMTTTPFLNNLFSLANTAGSLVTTAEDNVQFWYKLWSGQMVNAQSWKEMTTMTNIGNGAQYGLGIFRYNKAINGRTCYSHGGTFFGYINENIVDTTSGVTVAALTNQDSVNNSGVLALIIKSLHKVSLSMPATGVAEVGYNTNTIAVYPNPTREQLFIQLSQPILNSTYALVDLTGKEMISGILTDDAIAVSAIQPGLYFLYVKEVSGRIIHTQKIQIQ
jgi:D-alanyl-D-alanine carboxypeptidase